MADHTRKQAGGAEKTGFFSRMKQAVTRTRESFTAKIDDLVAMTRTVDEAALEDLESALLTSDLGVQTTTEILDALRERAKRKAIEGGAELRVLLKEQIRNMLESPRRAMPEPDAPPKVTFLVGVNGTGKTTTSGKLAAWYRGLGKSVLLCAADTFRAAAIEQLGVWAGRLRLPVVAHEAGADPSAVMFDALDAAVARGADDVIVDTAGRLHTRHNLMEELAKIRRTIDKRLPGVSPDVLFVLDATTGQNGLAQAKAFHEAAPLTGIVLTKLDSTAKGGIVFAIEQALAVPVVFAGVGERVGDLVDFDPHAFVEALFEETGAMPRDGRTGEASPRTDGGARQI